MSKLPLPAVALALALAFTGCIANMGDFKDNLAGDDETLAPAAVVAPDADAVPVVNETPKKAPVARISVFGPNGALVYKASFAADDPAEVVLVDEKTKLSLIGSDSEAVERGATIASYAWTFNGQPIEGGRQANVETGAPGIYAIVLTVTDSNGKTDTQTVKLGVAPKPFEVVTELVTGVVAGAEGTGQNGEVTFDLALDESNGPAAIQSVKFLATPPVSCDAILEVVGPEGESLGAVDTAGNGGAEVVNGGALAVGAYSIIISPFACAAPEGVVVTVTVTYLPLVAGLEAGHGDHAGH